MQDTVTNIALVDNAHMRRHKMCWRNVYEECIRLLLLVCGGISVLSVIGILLILLYQSASFFQHVSLAQVFFDTQWTPLFINPHYGIWPLLAGTVLTTTIALLVAVPFGLLSAIYLSEFAHHRVRGVLKPMLEQIAGIPTVVFGYFALVVLTPFLQLFVPKLSGFNALSAGIAMGIMITPTISSLAEDALSSVPRHFREAAYALGARKLSVIFRIVVPQAFSGITAAIGIALARALGEAMIVTIAAGQRPILTLDPRVPMETMTAFVVQVSMGDVPRGTVEYQSLFVVALSLFVFTYLVNGSIKYLSRLMRI